MTPAEALVYLAGQPGFADQVDADGVLWTHGQKVGIRVGGAGFELVAGPGLSGAERYTLASRHACPVEVGSVFASHTYHPHVLRTVAYVALHAACLSEAGHYQPSPDPRIGPTFEDHEVGCCDLYGTPHKECRHAPDSTTT